MRHMKKIIAIMAVAAAAPLAAENVNGFENFTLSRNGGAASDQSSFASFSSRTWTEIASTLQKFSSLKPRGLALVFK